MTISSSSSFQASSNNPVPTKGIPTLKSAFSSSKNTRKSRKKCNNLEFGEYLSLSLSIHEREFVNFLLRIYNRIHLFNSMLLFIDYFCQGRLISVVLFYFLFNLIFLIYKISHFKNLFLSFGSLINY